MASVNTNRFAYKLLGWPFRGATIPTVFYLALVTDSAGNKDDNTMSDLTEIAAGNGYTAGGQSLTPGATDFDVWTEDDTNDRALIQLADVTWSASGGAIPASGSGARFAALTDDNGTVANREVYTEFDLASARTVSDGQDLTIQDAEIRVSPA